ncbi:sensor domain-containing protein [Streptomyces sp. NPDC001493]
MTDASSLRSMPQVPDESGPVAHRFRSELEYLLSGLPLGVAAFTVAVTGFALGVSTLVVWIGLPILAGTLRSAVALANSERRRVAALTGRPFPLHHLGPAGAGWAGMLRTVREPRPWRDLVHLVVAFPLQVVTFCVALTWTLGGVGELLYFTWSWALPQGPGNQGLAELMFDNSSRAADIGFNTVTGVVLLATAVPVVRGLTAARTRPARALLGDRAA